MEIFDSTIYCYDIIVNNRFVRSYCHDWMDYLKTANFLSTDLSFIKRIRSFIFRDLIKNACTRGTYYTFIGRNFFLFKSFGVTILRKFVLQDHANLVKKVIFNKKK